MRVVVQISILFVTAMLSACGGGGSSSSCSDSAFIGHWVGTLTSQGVSCSDGLQLEVGTDSQVFEFEVAPYGDVEDGLKVTTSASFFSPQCQLIDDGDASIASRRFFIFANLSPNGECNVSGTQQDRLYSVEIDTNSADQGQVTVELDTPRKFPATCSRVYQGKITRSCQ